MINCENSLSEVLFFNHHLLPIVNRFGVQLGMRDKTIEELCTTQGIDTAFFLTILNVFQDASYFPKRELLSFSPHLVIDFLSKTHQYYIKYTLPMLKQKLEDLLESSNSQEMRVLVDLFENYERELFKHFKNEEKNVFAYGEALMNNKLEDIQHTMQKYEDKYLEEHENVDDKLTDIKNLIIKYLEPNYDEHLCQEFLASLFHFEQDIKQHERIENLILIPQIINLEKKIKLSDQVPLGQEIKVVAEALSKREIEVLKLIAMGHSNKIIADSLHISTHTAITHRKNIIAKTGIHSASGLSVFALLGGYIDASSIQLKDFI